MNNSLNSFHLIITLIGIGVEFDNQCTITHWHCAFFFISSRQPSHSSIQYHYDIGISIVGKLP